MLLRGLIRISLVNAMLLIVSQSSAQDTLTVPTIEYKGELIPFATLEPIFLHAQYYANGKKAPYNRLRNAVFVTYPYARRAAAVMNDIDKHLAGITNKKERKKYIRSREKELKKEFSDPLSNLSVYQGKVLMKLIHRETGDNCYEIIKEFKGGLNARIYQTAAFFYNTNLKQNYDPEKKDAEIEGYVLEVQRYHGYTEIRRKPASNLNPVLQ